MNGLNPKTETIAGIGGLRSAPGVGGPSIAEVRECISVFIRASNVFLGSGLRTN